MRQNHFLQSLLIVKFLLLTIAETQKIIPVKDPNNITLTFGSCNSFYGREQSDIFYKINSTNPDTFIWLGDVVYADIYLKLNYFSQEDRITKIKTVFNRFKNTPEYQNLLNHTNIIGVWDDHDYGLNDGNKHFHDKELFRNIWLEFIDEPEISPRRTQKCGIYTSYFLGAPDKVHVILLDVRFCRDSRLEGIDILGEEQWEWLESEIQGSKAKYIVIGSGSQIFPSDRYFTERWHDPAKDRLYALIKKYKRSGVFLITGDVHFTEILKHACPQEIGYTLYEFTSSGLTHYSGNLAPIFPVWGRSLFPDTYSKTEDRYYERNFGFMSFQFGDQRSGVQMRSFNYYGIQVLEQFVPDDQVQYREEIANKNDTCRVRAVSAFQRQIDQIILRLGEGNKDCFALLFFPYVFFLAYQILRLFYLIFKKFCCKKRKENDEQKIKID